MSMFIISHVVMHPYAYAYMLFACLYTKHVTYVIVHQHVLSICGLFINMFV